MEGIGRVQIHYRDRLCRHEYLCHRDSVLCEEAGPLSKRKWRFVEDYRHGTQRRRNGDGPAISCSKAINYNAQVTGRQAEVNNLIVCTRRKGARRLMSDKAARKRAQGTYLVRERGMRPRLRIMLQLLDSGKCLENRSLASSAKTNATK